MTVIYILLAVLLLGILVAVHEFGHFLFSRLVGIEVREFSIGMGPLIWGHTGKRGTKFSLRLIPMGGYCAFYGEDDVTGESQNDPRSYNKQPVWKRMISVLMGPGMNFILAFVVAVAFYAIGGVETVTGYDPYVYSVNAAGPAYDAGLKDGDIITEINGQSVLDGTTDTLMDRIDAWKEGDAPLHLTIRRGNEQLETDLTPFWDNELQRYRIGITISAYARTAVEHVGLLEAVKDSWNWCIYAGGAILGALKDLVTTGAGLEQTSGPVGVVTMVSDQVRQFGLRGFLDLLILISINLGIMNLLPIPGLDGSRFLFMLLEAIRRKPIPPQKEAMVHLAGYVLLFGFMIFITFKDIFRLIH